MFCLHSYAQDCKVSRSWLGCPGNHHWGNCKLLFEIVTKSQAVCGANTGKYSFPRKLGNLKLPKPNTLGCLFDWFEWRDFTGVLW